MVEAVVLTGPQVQNYRLIRHRARDLPRRGDGRVASLMGREQGRIIVGGSDLSQYTVVPDLGRSL